ncbi:glycylpeptide N-tetradecanoyltransferase [Thecamonas trahens ATCC 50062]|uniref:Glycylpeptide N-tetradecanoyltransferase n=1 Tax=Thecamonas trahens ATCC 50062 TaxID=461836 RepID=A0A0L0DBX7_THETB|nr:glycylpeptide N-tetradecanoyltransferase [Thecamonas trahens ATCC 50062]KNC49571.1 glycylpeptide N-tetradecanoyltransferase [Thecamonas trahens ATCC 50062]|eukprot:XP_013757680.1 glycylpeptide N-tetradecanoyltransferase [Thecamonas trahens ATCC 50062]
MADDSHKFWDTQPVPKLSEDTPDDVNEPIVPEYEEIRQEPYKLPPGFEWSIIDIDAPEQLTEVYTLLAKNYVEDDDCMFRFDYSREFLCWALKPPGWLPQWHLGVRSTKKKSLLAFISAVPADIHVRGTSVPNVEINFLCVHKKLRTKRLAPVLIQEITRRVHLEGIFQAVYTAGVVLPRPIASCMYYHRSLNPKKLVEVEFSYLKPNMTMKRLIRLYKLPNEPVLKGLRPMTPADVPSAAELLRNYLTSMDLYQRMSDEEFAHWLLPRDGVVSSYVIADDNGNVTDFCSFYSLPSTIIDHPKYNTLNAAYSYYNVATSVELKTLMNDALILANSAGFDVFNALDLMDNADFLTDLKFGKGDGHLQYYTFNWRTAPTTPSKIGLVLL